MHDVLGRMLRMHENMDALYLLLLHRLSIQNCPSKLRGCVPTVRPISENSQAWPALHQSMHWELSHHKHEDQRYGFTASKYHHQRQRVNQYRCVCIFQSGKFTICFLSSAELHRGHFLSDLCHFKKYMWPIYTARLTWKETINLRWHWKTGRSVCELMGCWCNFFIM